MRQTWESTGGHRTARVLLVFAFAAGAAAGAGAADRVVLAEAFANIG